MSLDQRARAAGTALLDRVDDIAVPDVGPMVRRANRRRHLTTAAAALVVLAAVGAGLAIAAHDPATSPPAAPPAPAGWERIMKADAGLPRGASLDAVTSDGERALLSGALLTEDWWEPTLWWSDDGHTWHRAEHPPAPGLLSGIALHGDIGFASGIETDRDGMFGDPFFWRSDDGGETWRDLGLPRGELGAPAPEMGRPSISPIVFHDGWWVGAGGSSTGYAGIWTSRAGRAWEQVLESDAAGGVNLVELDDGRLMAYGPEVFWVTDDPTDWGDPHDTVLPDDRDLRSVAPGGRLAVGGSVSGSHLDNVVLRADDLGQWEAEPAFDEDGAFLTTAFHVDGLDLVVGADARSRPTAWLSRDSGPWQPMPSDLRNPPGGVLGLATEVDGQLVVLGTAPELDRYYVYEP